MKIKVSINEADPVEVDTVRVFMEGIAVVDHYAEPGSPDKEFEAQLQVNFTGEGIINDLIDDTEVLSTSSETYGEVAQALLDG